MVIELEKNGLVAKQQLSTTVYYAGVGVGEYFVDILVNDTVILELKTTDGYNAAHGAQLNNYLKATGKELGLLLYFGVEPKVKRIINYENKD